MYTQNPTLPRIAALFTIAFLTLLGGCRQRTHALFTRPELRSYQRYAIVGLTEEQEQILMATYLRTFSELDITFLERGRLQDVMGEQDLLQGRLNNRTRAKISQILGVELLLICAYDPAGPAGRNKKMRIRIVDSETGIIVGSVITQAGRDFERHCYMAAKGLKADLAGKKSYRGPSTAQRGTNIPLPM
ncbi:MAG: hypothetical protein IIA65_05425 [Planctomycetes bacterium]|nr:hypothetical protein [Planctomycetota bacterium]